MKEKISITLNEKTVLDIFKAISSGKYRNKSHVVEYALRRFLDSEKNLELNEKERTIKRDFAIISEVENGRD